MQGVSVVVGGWEVELPSAVGWRPLGEVLSCEAVVVSVELVVDVVVVLVVEVVVVVVVVVCKDFENPPNIFIPVVLVVLQLQSNSSCSTLC